MVNRRIHPQIHAAVLRSLLDPALPSENMREAVGGMSLRTQQRAVARLEATGSLEFDTSRKGRPPSVDRDVVEHILWQVGQDPSICLKRLQEELLHINQHMSLPTISRTLEREGFTYKRIKKIALERSAYSRTDFIHRMADYKMDQIIWIDESAKDERTCTRAYGWAVRGQDAVVDAPFVRGIRYSILPAMTVDGYIALDIIESPVNRQMFHEFLNASLFPLMNPFPGPRSVVVLDNCSIHKGHEIVDMFQDRGFKLEYLPAYSPDFNPIEESFAVLKAFIRRQPDFLHSPNPIADLAWAADQCITAEKCIKWITHAGY